MAKYGSAPTRGLNTGKYIIIPYCFISVWWCLIGATSSIIETRFPLRHLSTMINSFELRWLITEFPVTEAALKLEVYVVRSILSLIQIFFSFFAFGYGNGL